MVARTRWLEDPASLLSNSRRGPLFRYHGLPRVAVCFLFGDSTTSAVNNQATVSRAYGIPDGRGWNIHFAADQKDSRGSPNAQIHVVCSVDEVFK